MKHANVTSYYENLFTVPKVCHFLKTKKYCYFYFHACLCDVSSSNQYLYKWSDRFFSSPLQSNIYTYIITENKPWVIFLILKWPHTSDITDTGCEYNNITICIFLHTMIHVDFPLILIINKKKQCSESIKYISDYKIFCCIYNTGTAVTSSYWHTIELNL